MIIAVLAICITGCAGSRSDFECRKARQRHWRAKRRKALNPSVTLGADRPVSANTQCRPDYAKLHNQSDADDTSKR